ncbi:MAG: DUF4465 domain-containing protein [Dysgonamonadaceae bacterium]|jgi:hypothetical protein|nr:DUF4465 domain-containing protein [Dysgonamonadaceae bacterium]
MKKNKLLTIIPFLLFLLAVTACQKDELDLVIPYNDDITLNELKLDKDFTHVVPDGGFDSKGIHFNTVKGSNGQLEAGFAYSNRSNRSFTWTGTEAALDTNRYSVFTVRPNRTETYAVARVKGDDAYFTLDKPRIIEHILAANTTYAFLALTYGDYYGGSITKNEITGKMDTATVANPRVPSAPRGVWYTYVPGGVKKMSTADKDFYRIIAKGYLNGTPTKTLKFDLACCGSNPEHPAWDYIVDDWYKFDLTDLGTVDKVVFNVESSDVDPAGNIRTPTWFCLDGIRLKR